MSIVSSLPGRHLLALGLPEAGKTTFLAAFWHVVESEAVAGTLTCEVLADDREYLNMIRGRWLACEQFERTSLDKETWTTMHLRSGPGQQTMDVTFPDLSGELVRQRFFANRRWPKSFDDYARIVDGLLLFINPKRLNSPISTTAINDVLQDSFDRFESPMPAQMATVPAPAPWDAQRTEAAVVLVDLVQVILERRLKSAPLRIAVIVSAWDSTGETEPMGWLTSNATLFNDYILANADTIDTRVYGISAQGGDIKKDNIKENLLTRDPAERIQVVGPGLGSPHDITAPVRWLLS